MIENSRNRIAFNAISSAIQVVIVGLSYFFVYRILVIKLGVDLLGVWSLIIATASISNLANLGFTSALVKFVAEYNANNTLGDINKLLFTSFFSMLVLFTAVVLIVYFLAYFFIDKLIDARYVKVALNVLPLSLISLFINTLGSVLTSALEGFQRNYIRNFIYSVTVICYLILTILLIPGNGLIGLAYAQVIQSLLIFAMAYYFIIKQCRTFNLLYWNWDTKIFRNLFSYGYKIQVISIFQMIIDPVTKILISKFSGITTLGFYEMASRLIIQLRQVIASMTQVTIPIVSHFNQTDRSAIKYIYDREVSFIVFLVFPLVAGILLFTPYLSGIWIGHIEPVFINCVYILALSMLINILCAPAYFNSLGEGNLNGILFMNVIVLIINVVLGVILGKIIPVYGVVLAWGLSYAVGSLFLIYYYQKRNNFSLISALNKWDYLLIIGALMFSIVTRYVLLDIAQKFNYSLKSLICFFFIYSLFFMAIAFLNRNFKLLNIFQYLR
jgi:O-antigen/teichoic acid export membrane protein